MERNNRAKLLADDDGNHLGVSRQTESSRVCSPTRPIVAGHFRTCCLRQWNVIMLPSETTCSAEQLAWLFPARPAVAAKRCSYQQQQAA